MMCSKASPLALLLTVPCLLLAASTASADVMTYEGTGLSATVQVRASGHAIDGDYVEVGQLLVGYGGHTYTSYCVDIDQYVATAPVAERDINFLTNRAFVAYLFETYAPSVQSDIEAAALGVALWEVLNEDQAAFSASSGSFYITADAAVVDAANILLASLPASYTPDTELLVLHSSEYQDVLIGQSQHLPEPGAASLLMIGGLSLVLRRRRKQELPSTGRADHRLQPPRR